MGSIADLLGDQLRAGLAQLVDPATEDDAPEGAQASSIDVGEYVSTQDHAREAAMEAVLDEADLAPADARAELTLRGDLDMDDVSLYAVVARRTRGESGAYRRADRGVGNSRGPARRRCAGRLS